MRHKKSFVLRYRSRFVVCIVTQINTIYAYTIYAFHKFDVYVKMHSMFLECSPVIYILQNEFTCTFRGSSFWHASLLFCFTKVLLLWVQMHEGHNDASRGTFCYFRTPIIISCLQGDSWQHYPLEFGLWRIIHAAVNTLFLSLLYQ